MQICDPLARTESSIAANHEHLIALLVKVEEAIATGDHEAGIRLIQQAANWAWNNGCGIFSSPRLESACEQISKQLVLDSKHRPEIGLHGKTGLLLSSIHEAGGHSRLAERWIEQDTQRDYVLILIRQDQYPIPESIHHLNEAGRLQILRLDQIATSQGDRALTLRHLVSQLDAVVLLPHPDDPLPSIALTACKAMPTTLLVDHASHTFWLGAGIAHLVIPLLESNARICHQRRGIPEERLSLLPLPLRNPDTQISPIQAATIRTELAIPDDAIVLLSSGWPYKFRPMAGTESLYDLLLPLMQANTKLHLIVAGPTTAENCWENLCKQCGGQIHLLGKVNESRLNTLFSASDIYLDSAPFPSGLAILDAIMAGLPAIKYAPQKMRDCGISLDCDDIPAETYIFNDAAHYRQALSDLIESEIKRQELAARMQGYLLKNHDTAAFLAGIELAFSKASGLHERIVLDQTAASFRIEDLDRYLMLLASNHDHIPVTKDLETSYPKFPVRALAFHLPQFHAIPENDAWWGSGFTEWNNVRKGAPLFEGHYQPHVPDELGYYDLSNASVLARQADMARRFGLAGFCFYYYWFDGRRLLEKPVDQLLQHPEIDLPFCLNWANENWTRRWDGGESQILMKQGYSPELDFKFAEDLARYFRDPRYIRVNGKPLLLIYRTDIIPEVAERSQAWREAWRKLGVGEVYLVRVESFKIEIPDNIGFDAACEFFPHQVDFSAISPFPFPQKITDAECRIGDYEKLARQIEHRSSRSYKLFPGLIPSWDNAARRHKGGATLFVNASPARYQAWMERALQRSMLDFDGDERLLFINAWNEWGEGCHLEPDLKHGYAYLEATRKALDICKTLDVDYERRFKPYQDWLTAREPARTASTRPLQADLSRACFVVQTTQTSDALLQVTLDNLRPLQIAGAVIIVASREKPAADCVWIHTDALDVPQLRSLASSQPEHWFCLMHGGDLVSPEAFIKLFHMLVEAPAARFAYADEDALDARYGRHSPCFKPDYDPDLLAATQYIGRLPLFTGGFFRDASLSDAFSMQEALYALALQADPQNLTDSVIHYPELVFHAQQQHSQGLSTTVRQAILARHFATQGVQATIEPGLLANSLRVRYSHEYHPLVSIIVPTKNQVALLSRCMESLTERTTYPHYEILIVDNGSDDPDAVAYLRGLENLGLEQIRVYSYPHPFNFAAMNNLAAREARGEYLLLLNNDTAIIQADWLEALLNHGQRQEVGAVGAKLLYPDGKVQHAGVVLGLRGPADHPFLHEAMNAPGYAGRLLLDQRYCAVTAACMLVRKSVYEEVGGMDETDFKVSYNDVDLCLKIRQSGHEVIWTPHAKVMHVGSVSQKTEDSAKQEAKRQRFESEKQAMYRKWMPLLANDPAYNRNLSLSGNGFELESSPLFQHPQEGQAKIYALCADNFGSGLYRTIAPTSALMEAGHAVGGCGRAYLDTVNAVKADPSTIIFQRQITETQIGYMQDYRNYTRAKLIFELDDYLPNLPVASLHKSATPKDVMRNMRRAMDLCDRVVVSTEALKHALDKFHRDIVVLPNHLPVSMWDKLPPRPVFQASHKPRVGWAGGIGHTGDLRLITDIVRTLSDRVDWVFFGMQPEEVSGHVAEFYPGVSVADYPESLARLNLDLALAPLEDNRFNECKSNLRLLEYGICGYPVIASDALPYRCGLPVTLVKNRFKDWLEAIESKLADIEALQQEGLALQAVIRKDWMLSGNNLMRWRDGWMLSAR